MSAPLRTTFAARPGGVSTAEVGTVTGELELESRLEEGRCRHRLRYAGAEEWYRVEGEDGGPVEGDGDLERAHEALVDSLRSAEEEGAREPADPPHGSQRGRDADDPAAGSFGGARRG